MPSPSVPLHESLAAAAAPAEPGPAGVVIWVRDAPGGPFLDVSVDARGALGFSPSEWTAPGFWPSRIVPEDRSWVEAHARSAAAGRSTAAIEYRVLDAAGEERWIRELVASPASAVSSRETGVLLDVTAARRREQELRTQRDLGEALLAGTDALVLVLDPTGTIARANPACERTLGRVARSMLGRPFAGLFARPDERAGLEAAFARAREGAHASLETHALGRGGRERVIGWTFARMPGGPEKDPFLLATGGDLTARLQVERALRERESELFGAQRMDAVGRLARGVTHDFNNLLTAILGFAHALRLDLPADGPAQAHASAIFEAAEHAADLTAQLRDLAQRGEGRRPEPIEPATILRGLHELLARMAGADVTVRLDLAAEDACVLGDASAFTQVVFNLALNARDAMPSGGTLTLALDTLTPRRPAGPGDSLPSECVRLRVTDTGCGMDEAVRARAFEPLFTTKGEAGTGLGLAIVRGVIERWGGTATIESAPGAGTTVQLLLPRVASDRARAAEPAPHVDTPGPAVVLVLEDDPHVRQLMRETLRRGGHRVLVAANGDEAIACASREPRIDLVVADVVLPGLNGRQVVERLRESRPGLRVLYVSGYSDDAVLQRGVTRGEDALLAKPFGPDALARRVRELLAVAESRG